MSALRSESLAVVRDQLATATAAKKCHSCGCLRSTVAALAGTSAREPLADVLRAAEAVLVPSRYDCLGCGECYPAIAANAFAEGFPDEAAGLDLCPTEAPEVRAGWPPLPGDYQVVRYRASVAVCTLNDAELSRQLAERAPAGLAIVGTMHTENLGIERVIANVLANPHIRHLVVCGEDTQQAVGHLPGQSIASLFANGLDARGRIQGARGKRPVITNLSTAQVSAFSAQVELIAMIGETNIDTVVGAIESAASRALPPLPSDVAGPVVASIQAKEPRRLVPDPSGFFVVYPEPRTNVLIVEHYENSGTLTCVIEGRSPAALTAEVVARTLISRLDHAAYLGRELARAEHSLLSGEPYVQDRAPGEIEAPDASGCGCNHPCGEPS